MSSQTSIINGQHVIQWLLKNTAARELLVEEFTDHINEGFDGLSYDDCFRNILYVLKDRVEFEPKEIKKLTAVTFMLSRENVNRLQKLNLGKLYDIQCKIDKIIEEISNDPE